MSRREYRYGVIGLGGIGSGIAYWLARRAGGDVVGLEQFELGHDRGASEDHSRIVRLAYHNPQYVELAKGSYDAWAVLEQEAEEELIMTTGGLDFFPAGGPIPLEDYSEPLTSCGVPFEVLDSAETMKRWPQWQLTDDIVALYQEAGGIAPAVRCNAAHARSARAHGATLLENTAVEAIRPIGDAIEVVTGEDIYRFDKLIIAADSWTNELLAHVGMEIPLTITQEQVGYYATPYLDDFSPERFPVWIWHDACDYYGMPVFGERGVKVAQDVGGDEVTALTRTFEPNPGTLQRVEDFCLNFLPSALGPLASTKTCLYTMPPDRDFILDALPDHPNVFLTLGAAHGFKFASLFGKIMSELAIDGSTEYDISPFKADRPILSMENPPKTFTM
ncbi:MAG: N-methyl-L-tryptophan oxidase [Actinomycetota bacterium]|nr:N-methyl-L-tryptophan oxidase [Actinomycetota bacterium]